MGSKPSSSGQAESDSPSRRDVLLDSDRHHSINRIQGGAARYRPSRRGTLSRALVAVTSLFGVSTVAAGTVPDSKVARDAAAAYNSVPDVRSAVQTHAGGLLQLLANRELIETPAVSSLPVTELYSDSMTAYFESEEGVIVFGTVVDGEPRTRIEMKTWTSEGQQLIVVVRPPDR